MSLLLLLPLVARPTHPVHPLVKQAGLPAVAAFDLVMANILRGPLLELAPRLASYCRPGGRLMLSGILQEQVGLSSKYSCTYRCIQRQVALCMLMHHAVKHLEKSR
jgi:hypothetical protein